MPERGVHLNSMCHMHMDSALTQIVEPAFVAHVGS